MCRSDQAGPSPGRVSFRRLRKIAADDRLYLMHQGMLHWTPSLPSEPHPVHADTHRRALGWFVWGKGGRGGQACCWGSHGSALWACGVLHCFCVVFWRCDAMRARSRIKRWLARIPELMACLLTRVGGRARHGLLSSSQARPESSCKLPLDLALRCTSATCTHIAVQCSAAQLSSHISIV